MENKKDNHDYYHKWIPEEWKVEKIGNHINLLSGYAFSSEKYTNSKDSIIPHAVKFSA